MAVAYFANGAVTLNAASWSDATGFADDATLIIAEGSQAIVSDLNRAGSTTTGIDYLHILAGFSGSLGSESAGAAAIEFDSTYTTAPNLVIQNGDIRIAPALTVTRADITGGRVIISGTGTITTLNISGGEVVIQSGVVVTNLNIMGGAVTELGTASAPTTLRVTGGSLYTERVGVTTTVAGAAANVTINSGSADCTTMTISDGAVVLQDGNIATLTGESSGKLTLALKKATTIGSTAFTRRGNFALRNRFDPLATISNESAQGTYEGGVGGLG